MSLQAELEQAAAAAAGHAREGERVAAVIPAEPVPGVRIYLAAFESGAGLAYLALDDRHQPVSDARLVRDAVSLIALAERGEEVSAGIDAESIGGRFNELAERLDAADPAAAAAARAVAAAALALAQLVGGLRLAAPAYLDQLGQAAGALGAALDAYAGEAERLARPADSDGRPGELGEAAWSALAEAAAAGNPAAFGEAMAAAADSVQALADDVVSNYRAP